MPAFQYPPNVLSQLRAAWAQPTPWRVDPEPRPLPEDDVLQELLEACFHASFTSDERRATTFSVVVCRPEDAESPFTFSSRIGFNVHELRRLAPAGDTENAMIGVAPSNAGPGLVIWGFTAGVSRSGGWPIISVPGPGVLHVKRRLFTIFALQGGHAAPHWQAPVTTSLIADLFPDAVDAVLSTVDGIGGNAMDWRRLYSDPFFGLLQNIASHGHGAAVFVVPEEEAESGTWRRFVRLKYPCDDSTIWPKLLESLRSLDSSTEFGTRDGGKSTRAREVLREKFDSAARLTRVDGGLVITDRFRVLGFGCEVTAPATIETIYVDDVEEKIDDYGTRHRSAFRLCAACPNILAFVCSQDGGIKCVQTIGAKVVLRR